MKKSNLDQNKNWLPNIIDSKNRVIESIEKQTNSVLKQLREEFLSSGNNNKNLYWKTRPTRIFWLDPNKDEELFDYEYDRFLEVQRNNYYKKEVLKDYFSKLGYDEALEKINHNPEPKPGSVFPVITENGNDFLPLVSFSGFTKLDNDLCIVPPLSEASNDETNCSFFEKPIEALKKKLNIEINENYIPELALYREINGESYDLAFVTKILLSKHSHLFNSLPSICCTGKVDENGNIKGIKFAKEKYEAAKQMGFDYLFFPYENKDEISESENVIFFYDIIELNNCIIELANNKAKSRIIHWLSVGGEKPAQSDFEAFFSETINKGITYWQYCLKYAPIDEAIKRIKIIQEAYETFLNNLESSNPESITRFLLKIKNSFPTYKFYALIPELIKILKDCEKLSDYLYEQIKEAVRCQSPDFAIAVKILKNNLSVYDIIENQLLREKYPQLLCFYFKHPTELVYFLSSLKTLTNKETKLLEDICELINQDASDNQIINTSLHLLNPVRNYQFETKAETIPHSHQLALLDCTKENLKKNNRKKFVNSIKKYRKRIKSSLKNDDKEKLKNLVKNYKVKLKARQINNKKRYNNNLENSSNNIFENLLSLYLKTIQITDCGILALNKNVYRNLKSKSYKLDDKLERLNVNVAIVNSNTKLTMNSYRNRYFSEFCNSLNLGKMGNLITECIAFFYGKYVVRWDDPNELFLLTQNRFDLPFSIGLMCQKHPKNIENFKEWYYQNQYPKICSLIKEIFNKKKPTLRQLMWLYLLYYSYNLNDEYKCCYSLYKKIIVPELEKYLLSFVGSLKENSEYKREFEFIASLFRVSKKVLGYNSFENDVTHAFIELEENPLKTITRTEQLLYPIFYFLQEYRFNTPCMYEVKKFGSQLNNARFVIDFIRAFGCDSDLNELFKPIHGLSDLEKQLFEAMTIIRLDQEKEYDLLKNYILNNITSENNLGFALALLENE